MLASALVEGFSFDGSSVRGYSSVANSDLRLIPILDTFTLLPWTSSTQKQASIVCDIRRSDGSIYPDNPRNVLENTIKEIDSHGYTVNVSPEIEFFLFDKNTTNKDVAAGLPDREGYFSSNVHKEIEAFKLDLLENLTAMRMSPEKIHHEVAPGQYEITMKYKEGLAAADKFIQMKKAMFAIAAKHGFNVSFMPKPLYMQNGTGMHINYSFYDNKNKVNAFYAKSGEAHLSPLAMQAIAGNLKHVKEITALLNPNVNSYKRLVPGFEAPIFISWGQKNRSSLIRIPDIYKNAAATRVEIRSPDCSVNIYLAYAAIFKSALNGIKNKYPVPKQRTDDLFHDSKEKLEIVPSSLEAAIALMKTSQFVKELLGETMLNKYVAHKENEVRKFSMAVTDWELENYLFE